MVLLSITFFLVLFWPFDHMYRDFRLETAKAFGQMSIAPFGEVKFRHFFLADVLTSAKPIFIDTVAMTCFCVNRLHKEPTDLSYCGKPQIAIGYVISVIPYWWRFWQCIRRYYDSNDVKNLYNACKYATGISSALLGIMMHTHPKVTGWYWAWFGMQLVSTIFSYAWDLYMDAGLLRCWGAESFALREKIVYHRFFYYMFIVVNFALRFVWLFTAILKNNATHYPFLFSPAWPTLCICFELYRRF
jgi:hypothetical protein